MEVIKNQIDDLNIEVTIALKGEDYAEQEKKRLSAYRRNADFKGFRKGMVPAQLVKKIYGDQALYEAVNGIVSEQLDNFIKDNDLHILGEPIASESQKENEWKSGSDFEFKFDMGLAPKIDIELSKEDKVPCYKINVTEDAKAQMKENLLRQYGQLEEGEAAGEDDYVVVDFAQGERTVEGAYVAVNKVEGTAKKKFLGAKVDDKFDVDVTKAFTNETDRASMLKMKKEELAELAPKWKATVVNVKTFVPASENQETYDKIFGKDTVKTPEEFDAKIAERLEANYKQESDYRLSQDLRKYLVDKAGVQVPEAFLKRWLYESNKGKLSKEEVDRGRIEVEEYADKVISRCPDGAGDYEKIKYVYEYLIKNNEYVPDSENNQNILSVVQNGETVCQGYAYAQALRPACREDLNHRPGSC